MSETLIKVDNLHKKFCTTLRRSMAYGGIDILKAIVGVSRNSHLLRSGEFWALEDINFHLERGEILGIIGANGAGKSTLLRVLNGIYPPDRGRIEIHGGIGGLIALGAGFHPHLSGRENIFLNGTILGMRKAEIKKNLDSIIDFADIGEFIDSPVANYSSGMYARLGFSIAIHCVPDILLIDEVLSVGDMSFQNKCLRKIADLRRSARGVIFVGHNMDMVETICDKAILLHEHRVYSAGSPLKVIADYRSLSREKEQKSDAKEFKNRFELNETAHMQTDWVKFQAAGIMDESGKIINKIHIGEDIHVYYEFVANLDISKPQVGIGFSHPSVYPWNVAYDSNISNQNISIPPLKKGQTYRVHARFSKPNLIPGVYRLNVMIRNGDSLELYHLNANDKVTEFEIEPKEVASFIVEGERPPYNSLIMLETDWECKAIQ